MQHVLAASLMLIALLAGLWDIYVVARGMPGDQISIVLLAWASRFPVLPLIVGIILGHVFWPQRPLP